MKTRSTAVAVALCIGVVPALRWVALARDVDGPASQAQPASRFADAARTAQEVLARNLAGIRTGGKLSADAKTRRFAAIVEQLKVIQQMVPRDTFDVEAVARDLGSDAAKHHQWVRAHTALVPYRGSLRGAKGTLMDRRGNSLDRALLLAGLLNTQNVPVRLARAQLTADQLARLAEAPAGAGSRTTDLDALSKNLVPVVDDFATETGTDAKQIRAQLEQAERHAREAKENLRHRVATQTEALAKGLAVSGAGSGASSASPLEALRDHWWVQWEDGADWKDLDPDLAAPGKAVTAPNETFDLGSVPDELHHSIQVRVIVEKWDGRAVEETQAASADLRPSEVLGDSLRLQHVPLGWPKDVKGEGPERLRQFRESALKQREWLPVLTIGDRRVTGASILDTGDLNAQPGVKPGAGGGVADAYGGGAVRPGVLTAEWIEYEIVVPGRVPQTIRREIFDLLGPAARAASRGPEALTEQSRLSRSLSLMTETEILPLASQLSMEFVAHLTASRLIDAEPVLATAVAGETKLDQIQNGAILPGLLHSLAVARGGLGRSPGGGVYLEAPNVLSLHVFPRVHANGTIGFSAAFDIVANDVGVAAGSTADRFTARMEQGVIDANLEAMWLGSDAGVVSTADLFALADSGRNWVAVRTAADLSKINAAPDIKARLEAELRNGFVMLIPNAASSPATGWWRVDPRTGHTLSFGDRGWGQAIGEFALGITGGVIGGCVGMSLLMGAASGQNTTNITISCLLAGGIGAGGMLIGIGLGAGGLLGGIFVGIGALGSLLFGMVAAMFLF